MFKIDPYGTHLPLLVRCVAAHKGSIIECGTGLYSTPVLHALAHAMGTHLTSIESDAVWAERFLPFSSDHHSFLVGRKVNDALADLLAGGKRYAVALVDHKPPKKRAEAVELLRNYCDIIVCHDSENRVYEYEPVLSTFRHRIEWCKYSPWVTAVSDTFDFSGMKDQLN